MVVVMLNGRVPATAGPRRGAVGFGRELLNAPLPCLKPRYPSQNDAHHRALAGFSTVGGQSLPTHLKHLDKFASIAAFSPAIQAKNPVPGPADAKRIKLFYLA